MQPDTADRARSETPDTEALLQRILAAVEKDRSRAGLEMAFAIILGLATLASTWCGYQAKAWGGLQGSKQAAADTAERKAAEYTIVGLQMRTFDVTELLIYWTAMRQNDTETSDAVFARMRPQLRKAVEASLAAGVLQNPEIAGPLQRPEYVLSEEQDAKRSRDEASQCVSVAQSAGRTSGSYVLLTLMFASVLFFGGIAGTFTSRKVRMMVGGIALVVFLVTIVFLLELPVCKG